MPALTLAISFRPLVPRRTISRISAIGPLCEWMPPKASVLPSAMSAAACASVPSLEVRCGVSMTSMVFVFRRSEFS